MGAEPSSGCAPSAGVPVQDAVAAGVAWRDLYALRDAGDVVRACAHPRGTGTWITGEYMTAYQRLHQLGAAHSIEVWAGRELVGGLYGVTVGAVFTGESMFHRRTGASKVALVALRDRLHERGFGLIDAQLPTPHLASLGAVAIPRAVFLDRLEELVRLPVTFT